MVRVDNKGGNSSGIYTFLTLLCELPLCVQVDFGATMWMKMKVAM